MRPTRTIGVLCALPEIELPALQLAFGLRLGSKPSKEAKGERYWITSLNTEAGQTLRIVISCVGLSGNTESQIPTERLIEIFEPELLLFTGIGCGIKKYKLGDVATSDAVWAYEYLKTTRKGPLDRSRAKNTPRHVQDDVSFFSDVDKWRSHVRKCMRSAPKDLRPRKSLTHPELNRSVWIASGEKVLGNGELSRLNARHDMIRAGEMEGYGFATACEDRRPLVPWLVIRGISDYGDGTKDRVGKTKLPRKDEYHFAAAQAAACFAYQLLHCTYSVAENLGVKMKVGGTNSVRQSGAADISAVYSSDYDPAFLTTLRQRIEEARTEIVLSGMGLSFLKGNIESIDDIAAVLRKRATLKVILFYAHPTNRGIQNRVREEARESERSNRSYGKNWPTEHLQSIITEFQNRLLPDELGRISIRFTDSLPMVTIVKIDDRFFWYPYGSPNIRGKESPWFEVDVHNHPSYVSDFLKKNIDYYKKTSGPPFDWATKVLEGVET